MVKLVIQNFGGEIPRRADTMLPDNAASLAENVRLYSGALRTWKGSTFEKTPSLPNVETIYRFINPTTNNSEWLVWNKDVDVVRGALADDTDFRLYYTGDTEPRKTNWSMATTGSEPFPASYYKMGVPAPTTAPGVSATASGSALIAESRYYVYTYVNTFDNITEESAPSPASAVVNITAGQKVTVDSFATAPTTDLNITHINIYRTQPGEKSDGAFVFVAQIAVATTSYVDDLLSTQVGNPLTTSGWDEPPSGLMGLVSMANGMMAGFVGNSVYFCEPYFHHAWPSAYTQSIPEQIVGLGSYGNTLIVMTDGSPYAMVGVTPDQISVEKITMPEPCIAKRSIASDQYGVMYASPNGIVGIGPSVRQLVTNELFRRTEWQDYAPRTMVARIYDGKYFAAFASTTQGDRIMIISRDDVPALAFMDLDAGAFFTDVNEGRLYYIEPVENKIYLLDSDAVNPLFYNWQSKRFVFPKAVTFSCMKLDIDPVEIANNDDYNALVAAIEAANQAITGDIHGSYNWVTFNYWGQNNSLLTDVPPPASSRSAQVLIYDENYVLQCGLTVSTLDMQRIPAFKSRSFYIKLTGNTTIFSLTIATSFAELRDDSYPVTIQDAQGNLL